MLKIFNPITPKNIIITLVFPLVYFLLADFIKLPLIDYEVFELILQSSNGEAHSNLLSVFALGVSTILGVIVLIIIFSKIKGFIFGKELSEKTVAISVFVLTTIISLMHSLGISYYLESVKYYGENIQYLVDPSMHGWLFRIIVSLSLTLGVLLTLWAYVKFKDYCIINPLLLILLIGFLRTGGIITIKDKLTSFKNYFNDSKIISLKVDSKLLGKTEMLKILDDNMRNFLSNEDKYFDYKRVKSNITIKVKDYSVEKVKSILSQKHTLYFMGEDNHSLEISKKLFNTIELPPNIKKVKSSYTINNTQDYYFTAKSLSDLTNFISKLKIDEAYRIFCGEINRNNNIFYRTYIFRVNTELSGLLLKKVESLVDTRTNYPYILITFNKKGTKLFGEITAKLKGYRLGIIIDGVVKNAPIVRDAILGGRASITGITGITGSFKDKLKEAESFSNAIKSSMFTNFIKID